MKNNQKIPEGWSVKKLKECLEIKHGKPQHDVEDKNGIYPILASGGEIGRTNSFLCNKPSVLIGRKGTIDKPQYMDTPFWTVDTLFYSLIKSGYLAKYIFYKFETINWNKYNEGSTIPSLSSSTIHSIKVILPPLAEQEKIAEILGTWDEAIEKLSSLIEQKKLLKKGLMQKLLTGKTRLFKTSPLAGEVADLSASEGLDNSDNIKISSHRMYQPYIKEFSRDMRKNSTKAENLLWQKIRNGQLGFKFRRQHQIDNKYIADFICLEKRLIIELDGGQHNDRPKDKDRTLYLENNNFKVIRFWDNEILQNIDGCLEILLKEISLLNNPSPCPSPARGEGISATYSNPLPLGARKDVGCSLDTPHLAQECHPLPQGARKNERFSQPWKEVKLGEIFNIKKGQGLSKEVLDDNGLNKCILYGELYTKYSEVIKDIESRTNQSGGILSQIGDILIPASTTTTGIDLANATALLKENVLLGGDINILRAKKEVSSIFFAYLLTHAYKFDIAKLAQGITIVHLYGEFLKNMKVYIPSDISEQQAIANVLSTADEEIDLLNKKLILFKEQKKGLMQQLLTGNIRVKVN